MSYFRKLSSCTAAQALAAAACVVLSASAPGQSPAPQPSVIMIYTDDMGYGDISSFSSALTVKTPHIDRLSEEGMRLTNFYVSMPICSPSRAAVLSGMYSPRNRLTNYLNTREYNNNSDANDWMDPALAYLPKSFKAAGYATAHVGKWHMGGGRDIDNAPSIAQYGYDEFYSTWESPNPDVTLGIAYSPWDKRLEPGQVPRHERTEYMVDTTLDFLARHTSSPCFITLWPDDLHTPYRPSPAMLAKYGGDPNNDTDIKNFYGVLEEYDRQIGRLLTGLDTQGRTTDTIVFFTGDNGPSPVYAGHMRTDGMIGRKLSLHEGGIREPFIIRWPGKIPAGALNSNTIMSTVDLLRTLTTLAGVPLSAEAQSATDGEDLSAALLGTPMQRSGPLMWEYGRTSTIPRPASGNVDWSPALAMRDGDYKLLVQYNGKGVELYNLRTDRNETTNIASSNTSRVNSMKTQLLNWADTLPHRSHPYPAFAAVNYSIFSATEIATVAELQAAAGASSTARISGVTCDPNGEGDVFAIHEDSAGKQTVLRIDNGVGPISRIADSDSVAADIGAVSTNLSLVGGMQYSPGGNRIFLADNSLGEMAGQVGILSLDVARGIARQVNRSANFSGMVDLTAMTESTIMITRSGSGGNNTVGSVSPITGAWTQQLSSANMAAAAFNQQNMKPQAIAANSGSPQGTLVGNVFLSAEATGTGEFNQLFEAPNALANPLAIARKQQPALQGTHFTDLALDQGGNVYGFNDVSNSLTVLRATDGGVYFISNAQMQYRLNNPAPVIPTSYRGLTARMRTDQQADLFLSSSTGDHGIVRLRFGNSPASVDDWSLYVEDSFAD